MSNKHVIPITNGIGSKEITNGTYSVEADFQGYDNTTIQPNSQEIKEGVSEYNFTIEAKGTLTLHVTDDGTSVGVQIVGATFYRCDRDGKTYGNIITTNQDGNAVFEKVPFLTNGEAPTIYFKQITSDGEHEFNNELQNIKMDAESKTVEIQNTSSVERTFKITDANYTNLPIEDGNITLTE